MVTVDQKVRFDAFNGIKDGNETMSLIVTGTVYAVNYAHKVFHVVYTIGENKMRTSFNFCDIGKKVEVVQ